MDAQPIIFLAFANSSYQPLPSLAEECNQLTGILETAEHSGICTLVVRPYATAAQILDTFAHPAYHGRIAAFHYAGHADSYALLMEEANGAPAVAHAGGLAAFLGQQTGLQLVFLNGCSTAPQVEQILAAGVNVVIATSAEIEDQIATAFSTYFYRYLAGLDSIEHAYAKAQAAVQTLHGVEPTTNTGSEWPWALYQRPDAITAGQWTLGDLATTKLFPFEPTTVLIPAGPFLMGSAPAEGIPLYETPQHTVTLPPYRIGQFPVTNREYAEFLKRVKAQKEPKQAGWFLREPPRARLDHPVVGVSWHDACAYCVWLSQVTGRSYRLPSEAEWEKAARGSDGRRYPWGNAWLAGCCNVNSSDTTPANACPTGISSYGCLDMLGNVQEWTCTLWGTRPQEPDFAYPYDPEDGREIKGAGDLPPQARLVQRGGSFKSNLAEVRCSARGHADPASQITWRGFRVVMEV